MLLAVIVLLACAALFVARSKVDVVAPGETLQHPPTSAPVSLDNCDLVNRLLKGEISSSTEGLPSAGKPTSFGAVFWLKTPVLRATLPDSNAKVVLLKYNKYLPKQHTLKWSNTVSILSQHRDGRVFPRMYAYCKDPGDGFHYILVEWIDLHPSEMSKPTSFEQCYARADKLLQMLEILDEEMHLAFMDVKRGQWMARDDEKSFVLQDVDDIVRAPWTPTNEAGDLYFDQVERAQQIVQSYMGSGTSIGHVKKLWDEQFFPNGYTIRYTMILLSEILQGDMGFQWNHHCKMGMPDRFLVCFDKVLRWAATSTKDWPAPKQVRWAFGECRAHGEFDQLQVEAVRPAAAWRDANAKPNSKSSYISCIRSSDSLKRTDNSYTENLSWCETTVSGQAVPITITNGTITASSKSCCRAKGSNPCYYYVHRQQSLCDTAKS